MVLEDDTQIFDGGGLAHRFQQTLNRLLLVNYISVDEQAPFQGDTMSPFALD